MVIDKIKGLKSKIEQKEPTTPLIVSLDIGTEYVKALVAAIEGDELHIIGVGRQRQRLSDMHSGAIADIAGVVENCDKALTMAEEMAGVGPRRAIIGIAGELVKGMTTTIRYQRSDPEKRIDMAELERIFDRVRERTFERAKAQLQWESGNDELEVPHDNSALAAMHIDGHKVTSPLGFQGKDVAVGLYSAFAPMVHIGAFERVAEELDLELIAVPAQPFAVARSMTVSDANDPFSAILIDVGGGTSDIAVVNEGGIEGTKMFGIGGRNFTHTISTAFGVDFEKAEELKLKASADELETRIQSKVEAAIDKTLKVWASGVQLALEDFSRLEHLPHRVLLCGGGASLTQLVEALRDEEWSKNLPFTRKPEVQHIVPTDVIGVIDKTGEVNDHTFITAMGMLRIGLDTLNTTEQKGESIGDTMNRLLRL
jgi:cell division protein FtsA